MNERFDLCLVGGGPNALYVIERVLARKCAEPASMTGLAIQIFDRGGHFGSGCHYSGQPTTNHLNRIAAQIAFGADASNHAQVQHLLPDQFQLTLLDPFQDRDGSERALFGEASEAVFQTYVDRLGELGIPCTLRRAEVTDIAHDPAGYQVYYAPAAAADLVETSHADFVILCTGHGENRPAETWHTGPADAAADPCFINYIYPLEAIDTRSVPSASAVACRGLGLAALDLILWLTEGRGGSFTADAELLALLHYNPSGAEPSAILPFSGSGAFPLTRARNQKLNNPDLMHKPIFLTYAAIDQLREACGQTALIAHVGLVRQLDFDQHILPVMVTEMALVYYRTLFGQQWCNDAVAMIKPAMQQFLQAACGGSTTAAGFALLLEPVNQQAGQTAQAITDFLVQDDGDLSADLAAVIRSFVAVTHGAEPARKLAQSAGSADFRALLLSQLAQPSPWHHSTAPSDHLFFWPALADPLAAFADCPPEQRHQAAVNQLRRDILQAEQGNLDNPIKSAIDGVCRDIRDVLRYAVEFGGLTAKSQRVFASRYQRLLNRLAVGTSLKIMKKVHALASHGLLDLARSRSPQVQRQGRDQAQNQHQHQHQQGWLIRHQGDAGSGQVVPILIDARVHMFDLQQSRSRLYANLSQRGLIRQWQNPDPGGDHFLAGGLDIVPRRHLVVDAHGRVNPTMAALGVPTEGALYFHIAAQRPFCGDPIVVDADQVLNEALRALRNALKSVAAV